jgi:hypothetical protein
MNPKPIFTENGQPKTYDDFDKEKFADLIVQECINIIKTAKDGVFVSLDNAYVSAQFVNVTVKKIERIFRS